MSLSTFNSAFNHASKLMYIYNFYMSTILSHSYTMNVKYDIHLYAVLKRNHKWESYEMMFCTESAISYPLLNSKSVTISPAFKNKNKFFSTEIMDLTEFSEELDFQLSTMYNDTDLKEYYIGCLLNSYGFVGSYRRNIHHNTLNAIIRHIDDIKARITKYAK